MRSELSKDVALLKDIERKLGRTLAKNDRMRLHRLIVDIGKPKPRGPGWRERARIWLGTIAKIALALGLKRLFDHIGGQA